MGGKPSGFWRKSKGVILVVVLLMAGGLLKGMASARPDGQAATFDPARFVGRISLSFLGSSQQLINLYFSDAEARYLIPQPAYVDRGEAGIRQAVEKLLQGPGDGQVLRPSISLGLDVQGLALKNGTVNLTLKTDGAGLVGSLSTEALYWTLIGFPGVEKVVIKVDENGPISLGKPRWINPEPTRPDGGGEAGREEVGEEGGQTIGRIPLTLYFLWRGYLVPVTRWVNKGGESPAEMAMWELLAGPRPGSGLQGLPPGIRLLDFQRSGGMATVTLKFDDLLLSRLEAGTWKFSYYYLGVIYTLTEFPEITRVRFDIKGLTSAALSQCQTPLAVPLGRPEY